MSKETIVFVAGTLTFFVPFLGISREYKDWFFIGIGILLMLVGYRLRRLAFLRSLEDDTGERKADMFVESAAPLREVQSAAEHPKRELHI